MSLGSNWQFLAGSEFAATFVQSLGLGGPFDLHDPRNCALFLRHFHTIPELDLHLVCKGNVENLKTEFRLCLDLTFQRRI